MKEFVVAILIVLVIALVICGPFALLWSLNTLFPSLAIPYTLKTWAASFIIGIYIAVRGVPYKKD